MSCVVMRTLLRECGKMLQFAVESLGLMMEFFAGFVGAPGRILVETSLNFPGGLCEA